MSLLTPTSSKQPLTLVLFPGGHYKGLQLPQSIYKPIFLSLFFFFSFFKQTSTMYRLQLFSTFQNKKYFNFCLVGRTLDVTQGKIGSLQQTAEEVMTTFCNVIFLQHTWGESNNIVFLYIQNISNLNTWRFPFPLQFQNINKLFVLADIQIKKN